MAPEATVEKKDASQEVEERKATARERDDRRIRINEGLRKAAVFLISLDEDTAAAVLGKLSDEEAKTLTQEIMNVGLVDKAHLSKVVREFQQLINLSDFIKAGGADQAFNLLKKSFPSHVANHIIRILSRGQRELPFQFLKNMETETLLPFLRNEHPQTIAVILSHLEPGQAAEILAELSPESQSDVVRRIATLEHTSPEAIKQIESGLQKYVSTITFEDFQEVGGAKSCAEILNVLDRDLRGEILGSLDEDHGELMAEIKKLMFVFEDIVRVDEKGIQVVLNEVENQTLAVALKGASEELQQKILSGMSPEIAESIREEISFLGPVRVTDVEAAQQGIVDIVRRLEEAGEVIISGQRGGGAGIE